MSSPVIGAIARPQLPPERLHAVALIAEQAGLGELWLWEDCFAAGGVSMSAALLGATRRLRVGIGVLPFPLRNVALAAMEVAAIERVFPGRFIPGFGHGVQQWMDQVGARPASVLTLEREYVGALRALLSGETVTAAGDYVRLRDVRLDWPPPAPPLLHLAATGPRSLRMSGLVGDGTILVSGTSAAQLPGIRELIAEGRDESGRTGEHQLTVFVATEQGDVGATTALVESFAAAGAHRVVLEPAADEPDPEGFVRFVAEEIQPEFTG